jgi:phage baseplate assembly protein W
MSLSTVYKGIALPWGVTIPSVIEPKNDVEVIKSSIQWIILTALGERVMLPEFGSPVASLIGEPIDVTALTQMRQQVQQAINRWDDRVRFVDFKASKVAPNTLRCTIAYEIVLDPTSKETKTMEFDVTNQRLGG